MPSAHESRSRRRGTARARPHTGRRRRRELAQALAIDQANPSALVLQWRASPPEQRAALARTLTTTHPEDGRGWILLAEGLRGPASVPERESALRKAMALRPDDPTPLNNLAWIYVNQGKATEAVPLITRAIQIAPYDPYLLDTLAAVQAMAGRCSEAVASQARAIDALARRRACGRAARLRRPARAVPDPSAPPGGPRPRRGLTPGVTARPTPGRPLRSWPPAAV